MLLRVESPRIEPGKKCLPDVTPSAANRSPISESASIDEEVL